jgi:hypothetical protein
MSMCSFNFGYDVGVFSGVQAMNSFGQRFGEYNDKLGAWELPAWLSSLMTSIPFLGKAIVRHECPSHGLLLTQS